MIARSYIMFLNPQPPSAVIRVNPRLIVLDLRERRIAFRLKTVPPMLVMPNRMEDGCDNYSLFLLEYFIYHSIRETLGIAPANVFSRVAASMK